MSHFISVTGDEELPLSPLLLREARAAACWVQSQDGWMDRWTDWAPLRSAQPAGSSKISPGPSFRTKEQRDVGSGSCSATRSGLSPPHGLPSCSLLSLIVPGLQGVTFQGDEIRNSSDKQIFFIPNWFLSLFFCLAVVLGLTVGLSAEGCAVRQT